jgi:hypothetical protein
VAPKRHIGERASDWQLQLSGFPINLIEPVSGTICNVEQKFIHHRIAGIYCLNIALHDLYSSACNWGLLYYVKHNCHRLHYTQKSLHIKNGDLTGTALIIAIGAFVITIATCHWQHKTSVVR